MVSRLGCDSYGERALQQIETLGMKTDYIQWDDRYPTGTVQVYLDEKKQPDYTIIQNVAYDYIELTDELIKLARNVNCVCYGTLAQRNRQSHLTIDKILKAAEKALKVLDINLRRECYTPETVSYSLLQADVLKCNEDEAFQLGEMFSLPQDNLLQLTENLFKLFPLTLCLITLGNQGVLAVHRKGEQVYVPGYQIKLVDPLGSGDAFTAAFLHEYFQDKPMSDCCRYGNALGALVATTPGATSTFSIDDIQTFIQTHPERVKNEEFQALQVS
jgi:fructokinase